MYTETEVRTKLTADGYSAEDIEKILKVFPFGYLTSFDGCDGGYDGTECPGWDGLDRRCECGNRRVYWTIDGDYAYPDVY